MVSRMNTLGFPQHAPIHVLLVEDDEADFRIISDLFSDIDGTTYDIEWVSTYQKAIR